MKATHENLPIVTPVVSAASRDVIFKSRFYFPPQKLAIFYQISCFKFNARWPITDKIAVFDLKIYYITFKLLNDH